MTDVKKETVDLEGKHSLLDVHSWCICALFIIKHRDEMLFYTFFG